MRLGILAAALGFVGASRRREVQGVQAAACADAAFYPSGEHTYTLMESREVSPTARIFTFSLPGMSTPLDFKPEACITLTFKDKDGTEISRPYTPLNRVTDKGQFNLLVKKYPNSKMGTHLFNMKVGDAIRANGPWEILSITPGLYTKLGMIAGGTGIAPMIQVCNNILPSPDNTTKVSLLFANNNFQEILMRDTLASFKAKFFSHFDAAYVLTSPPSASWAGYTGHITEDMIRATMPAPTDSNIRLLVSGPPGMMKSICGPKVEREQGELTGILKSMGYTPAQVFKF